MQTINYYNHRIAYSIEGKGLPVVFLHGFGENRQMWAEFSGGFEDYQVIKIDFPGSGESEVMDISIARLAKIVNAVLMAESIEKCIMIGHSMGGYIALAFANLYEEKLWGYALFHSQPYADTMDKKEARDKSITFVEKHGNAFYFKGLMPKLFASKFVKNNEFIVDKLIHQGCQMSVEGVIQQLRAMRDRPDASVVLENAKVPVLFIIGKEDIAIPEENSLNQTFLPKVADIHILPNIGHMGMFETKQKTTAIIRNFIDFCVEN